MSNPRWPPVPIFLLSVSYLNFPLQKSNPRWPIIVTFIGTFLDVYMLKIQNNHSNELIQTLFSSVEATNTHGTVRIYYIAMDDTKEIMSDIYNTLVRIRYPKITTAIGEDVQATVLSGENRVALLSWLLAEKSPEIANALQNLKGTALEAKLSEYYSEIGICADKNIVLGKCTLREQLPFLRLLLEFIKCVHVAEPFNNKDNVPWKSIDDMIQDYILENPGGDSKPSRSESLQDLGLKEYPTNQESNSTYETKKEECVGNHETMEKEDGKGDEKEDDNINLLFKTEEKKFVEAFSTIESWPMFKKMNEENQKNTMTSMDADIRDICSNFSTLAQFLQTKEEIYNTNIPKELSSINTPLNKIVKDAVIDIEEAVNACSNSC